MHELRDSRLTNRRRFCEGNTALYILKGLCAMLVVFIHVRGMGKETLFLLPLMRIAVPCFYMISGYYLFKDAEWSTERILDSLKKIIRLLLVTTFIYIIFFIGVNFLKGQVPIPESWQTLGFWQRWFIYGDNICYPLWYLTAYIQVLLMLLIIKKVKLQKSIMWLVPVLLFCSVLFNRYSFLISDKAFDATMSRNAWFCALPCVLSGIWYKQKRNKLIQCRLTLALIITVVLAYVEYFLIGYYNIDGSGADYNLTTYPLAIITIIWCVQHPHLNTLPELIKTKMTTFGKLHSINVYLYHIMMLTLVELIEYYLPSAHHLHNAEVIIIMSLLLSQLLIKTRKSINKNFHG